MRTPRPRPRALIWAGLTLAGGMLWGSNASASSTGAFLYTIPNGNVFTCLACHTDMLGPTLTTFGTDILGVMSAPVDAGGEPDWAQVCAKDSDNDGQTNGQELGDPCCSWAEGTAEPRTAAISNPTDPLSKSADPSTPACAAPPSDSGGGCAVVGSAVGLSGSAIALVVMALAGGRRRRRRG
jgi:hypothetical protein